MEKIDLKINRPDRFDEVLKDSLRECGNLEIVTKHGATHKGQAGVMITFTVELPNGTLRQVQAVTTMSLFRTVTTIFQSAYNDKGFPLEGVGGATVFDDPNIE